MKVFLLLVFPLAGMLVLDGCGSSTPPPPPPPAITVTLSPSSALALDVNQTVPITAAVGNDPNNQGFDWALTCDGGKCGAITAHTASGASATFTAPAAPLPSSVTITAKLTGETNTASVKATISSPPTVATSGAIAAATVGSSYSFQLTAAGGAGTLTWALGAGTSLPDTLSLGGTGMITGTPSGTSGPFNFKVHVTDSGNPQLTSPDVQLSITVGAPAISIGLLPTSAYVAVKGSEQFFATATNDTQNGNIDWTLTLNGMACTAAECGSVSPLTTSSGSPTTYTAPANVPPANITLIATTVDGNPPATADAAVTVTAHGFVSTGSMTTEREYHSATLLDHGPALTNGKVLIAGGIGNNKQAVSSAEMFDPSSETFAAKGSMMTARAYHTATLLNDGTVLITGGSDQNGAPLSSAEVFDPTSGTFTPTKRSMETARVYHTATLLNDGTVLVAGGSDGSTALTTAELFDPASGTFTLTKGNMAAGRVFHTATLLVHGSALTNGKVLVAGGGTGATPNAELFDPTSGTFTPTNGNMEFDRRHHTATLLNDGTILVSGGGGPTSNPNGGSTAGAELFDPATGMFTLTKVDMAAKRANHRAILLNDGTVLVAGGVTVYACLPRNTCTTYLAAVELFDAASESFTATGDMTTPRACHTATLLKDGTVLVTGGDKGSGPLATAELYQ